MPMGTHPSVVSPMPVAPLAASYFWITFSLSLLITETLSPGVWELLTHVSCWGERWFPNTALAVVSEQSSVGWQWWSSTRSHGITFSRWWAGGELFLTPLRLSRSHLWGIHEFLGLRVAQCCPCMKEPPQTSPKAHQWPCCGAVGMGCCPARCLPWHLWCWCHLALSLVCWLPAPQLPEKGTQGPGVAIYLQDNATG